MSPRRAGWYPHPTMVDSQGYWDGGQWTGHVAPLGDTWTGAAPSQVHHQPDEALRQESRDDSTGLVLMAVILSLVFPIAGFVMGIVLLAKNRIGPGLACMAISGLIVALIALALVSF